MLGGTVTERAHAQWRAEMLPGLRFGPPLKAGAAFGVACGSAAPPRTSAMTLFQTRPREGCATLDPEADIQIVARPPIIVREPRHRTKRREAHIHEKERHPQLAPGQRLIRFEL